MVIFPIVIGELLSIARADPRFAMGRGQTQTGTLTYYLAKISRKLYDNEENWTDRGGTSKILLLINKLLLIYFSIFIHFTSAHIWKLYIILDTFLCGNMQW